VHCKERPHGVTDALTDSLFARSPQFTDKSVLFLHSPRVQWRFNRTHSDCSHLLHVENSGTIIRRKNCGTIRVEHVGDHFDSAVPNSTNGIKAKCLPRKCEDYEIVAKSRAELLMIVSPA
jgi:hypothetical protein